MKSKSKHTKTKSSKLSINSTQKTLMRIEKDSMGAVQIPKNALYGAQTQRAIENFPISGLTMPRAFIRALALIKSAAATANTDLKLLNPVIAKKIITVSKKIAEGTYDTAFPIDVFQTGSGTSSNMNMNEVISHLADSKKIHPNDHVNMSQSSNDVIPTTLHLSCCLEIHEQLIPALKHLEKTISIQSKKLSKVVKTGRTHLMDAMPLTFGQELSGWATQIRHNLERIQSTLKRLYWLPIGGTAVGTGINAHPQFGKKVTQILSKQLKIPFTPHPNYFTGLSAPDSLVELSGQLRVIAVSLMKIANDLRLMNSGPLSGLGEIVLPTLQPGSSIMPGKVNPVIPEAICMVAAKVIGNDTTISLAGASGNFQLNTMLPLIAYSVLESIVILSNGMKTLADKAIQGFTVNKAHLEEKLSQNPILVTALNPIIGYQKGAEIAKRAYKEHKPIKTIAREMTTFSSKELDRLLDPKALTKGGIESTAKNKK